MPQRSFVVGLCRAVAAGVVLASRARAGLTAADVERVIGQGVAKAQQLGAHVTVAVVDHEGNVLGIFEMAGQTETTLSVTLRGLRPSARSEEVMNLGQGIEGLTVGMVPIPPDRPVCGPPPIPTPPMLSGAALAAISKAGTAAFFSTQGSAFTPRTASFIIQQHFPPGVRDTPGGPLFGVQFSSLLCSDITPRLPFGLSGDPGGLPLYKLGRAVGGVGVEGDGLYTADFDPFGDDVTIEERIASAATRGFETPHAIRADQILVGGLRFPFANTDDTSGPPAPTSGSLAGMGTYPCPLRDAPASRFVPARIGGRTGTVDPRFPVRDSLVPSPADGGLRAEDVMHILARGGQQAFRLRAAIRRPLGDRARVNISVVDVHGNVLGIFRTADAPLFGFDVSVQKARGTAFACRPDAGATLLASATQQLHGFVANAARDGIHLDGRIAFAERSIGFLSRPFFPDGIDGTAPGPFSRPIADWSIFNDGFQVELVKPGLVALLTGQPFPGGNCTGMSEVAGGVQIFAGGVPLYRGRTLVGAVGVSGDGIDQDDAVAAAGSRGFGAPRDMRADRVMVRGVRLPYFKLPRRPEGR